MVGIGQDILDAVGEKNPIGQDILDAVRERETSSIIGQDVLMAVHGDTIGHDIIQAQYPQAIPPDQVQIQRPSPEKEVQLPPIAGSSIQRYGKGFLGGAVATVESMARGFEAFIPDKTIADSVANWIAEKAKTAREFYQPPDPKFADMIASGFGSMAAFLIPGLGISKVATAAAAVPRLAAWLGASASGAFEAMTEGGSAYARAREKGMSEQEAVGAATKTFWLNLPTVVFTNKLGLFGDKGGLILKGLKSAPTEAFQEFTQQIIGNFATKDPAFQGALESAAVGGIVGGVAGGAIGLAEGKPQIIPPEQVQPQSTLQRSVEGQVSAVVPPAPPAEAPAPKEGYYTPIIKGEEQLAELQSAGLPRGKFFALDEPFSSSAHDIKLAQKVTIPEVKNIYDPDGLLGKSSPSLSREVTILANKVQPKDFRQFYSDFLKSKGYDAYVRGIDGDPLNRELIVLKSPPESVAPKVKGAEGELAPTKGGEQPTLFTPQVKQEFTKTLLDNLTEDVKTKPELTEKYKGKTKETLIQMDILDPKDPAVILHDNSRRLFKRVGELVFEQGYNVKDAASLLDKALEGMGIDKTNLPKEIRIEWESTISNAGRQLNSLSKLSKELNARGIDLTTPKEISSWVKFCDWYRKWDNRRRGLLVSQMATSARNFISQGARTGLEVWDDLVSGTVEILTGKATPTDAYQYFIQDLQSIGRRFTKGGRQRITNILDKYPMEKAELLTTISGDLPTLDKGVRYLNFLNTSQEFFYRKMRFDAVLTAEMERRKIKGNDIPENILKSAIDNALDVTFANKPKSRFTKDILNIYRDIPFMTAISNPFPRFWANSIKFLWDYNPTGFTKLLDPKFRETLISKNPHMAYKSLSKAMTGTLLLGAAVALRNSQYAGEKWYEINTGNGKYIDTRAFAPFSTYLFLAEAMKSDNKLSGTDWLQGIVSINRISGTGLILVDIIRAKNQEGGIKLVKTFLGQYTGGFTVPFRTIKDFIAAIDPEEAKVRYIRERPLTGPALENVPYVGRIMSEAPKVTREEPWQREETGLRQMTGLTIKTKTPFEAELDRLGIASNLYPRTGLITLDKYIMKNTGKIMETVGNNIMNNPGYLKADDVQKEAVIKVAAEEAKVIAKEEALNTYTNEIAEEVATRLKGKTGVDKKRELLTLQKKGVLTPQILYRVDLILQGR